MRPDPHFYVGHPGRIRTDPRGVLSLGGFAGTHGLASNWEAIV